MNILIILTLYVTGFLFTYRQMFLIVDADESMERMDSAILSMSASIFWPFVLVGYFIYKVFTPVSEDKGR